MTRTNAESGIHGSALYPLIDINNLMLDYSNFLDGKIFNCETFFLLEVS